MNKTFLKRGKQGLCLLLLLVTIVGLLPPVPAFAAEVQTFLEKVPTELDPTKKADAYNCQYSDQWVPMFPTGEPDNTSTWPEWDDTHYAEIAQTGHNDVGSLYMKSQAGKNTAVTIDAGMTPWRTYTLGLWAKGTAQSQTLFSYGNGDFAIIETAEALSQSWQYYEVTFTAKMSQLNIGCRDWGENQVYIDNITLKDHSGKDLLAGLGDFYREVETRGQMTPTVINTSLMSNAYQCLYEDKWVPMFPTGTPDNSSTWPAWNRTDNYGEVVAEGYLDTGALHLVSSARKNTGVAINAKMEPGKTYTLGLWAKGTAQSQSLFSYDNGDFPIIETAEAVSGDWQYYEVTFAAVRSQLNLCCRDWGSNDIYVDNITLTDENGVDLLAGKGDFWEITTDVEVDANWSFEKGSNSTVAGWEHNGVLADSTMEPYQDNVYSGSRALRIHRQKGQIDVSFVTSEALIPVAPGDRIEIVSHIASRNSISGNFSMFLYTYNQNGERMPTGVFGQERITHTGPEWSQWDTYEMTCVVGAGVYYISAGMRIGGTQADVLIDDLQYYNYTENGNTVFCEDFAELASITGLPGGWHCDVHNGEASFDGGMHISGAGESRYYTDIYSLTTHGIYTLHYAAQVSGEAKIRLEAVDYQGKVSEATEIPLENGSNTHSFTAASAVYYRLWVIRSQGGTVNLENITIEKTGEQTQAANPFGALRFSFPTGAVTAGTDVLVTGTLTLTSPIPGKTFLYVNFVQSGTPVCIGKLQLTQGTTDDWPVGSSFTADFTLAVPYILSGGSYTVTMEETGATIGLLKVTGVTQPVTTTSCVESVNGRPTLFVNGQPQVPIWYARPENPALYEPHTVTKFAEAGVDTVVSYVFLNNYYGDVWTPSGFSPAAVDEMLLDTLAGNPDAKLMVALDFNAPQWWLEQNPGELTALSDSTPEKTGASFASRKWKEESGAIMTEVINHMMSQPYANSIIGFKITGGYTLEWNWWGISGSYDDVGDFSQCGIAAFRQWLTKKYQTDEALQQAYGDAAITLENAMPPAKEERRDDDWDSVIAVQTHQKMLDYELYMAEIKADTVEYFAKLVKDAVNHRLVVGTYGGYFYMGGGYEFSSAVANVYFQRMLQSEYIDFIKSPWMYGLREIGDSAEFMGPVDSLDLHGKLWIVEEDTRLNRQEMLENQDDKAAVGWTRNYQQSVEQLKRNFSYVLSKGMGMSFYNLMWNFTDDDQYYGIIGQMYEEMAATLDRPAQSTADIAVFVDGESNILIPYESGATNSVLYVSVFREQLKELGHMGAAYDMYTLDDLKDGLVPEHKINIFLGTTLVTAEERAAIESRLQKNGNILVWIFTSGISDGVTTDIAHIEALTGMDLSVIGTQRRLVGAAEIKNTDHWLTQGLPAGTFYGVESYDKLSPVIGVTDGTVLAYHVAGSDGISDNQGALAVKQMEGWTSVYSAVPNLPQGMLRNLLAYAGCHSYTDSGSDVIYASSDHVALHSIFAGSRTIRVPAGTQVYDVFRQEPVAVENGEFTVTLTGKETRLFRLTEAVREKTYIDGDKMTDAYGAQEKKWVPMYPTGQPEGTWQKWDMETYYGKVVEEGCQDLGALYLKSIPYRNTGVAIQAGMTPGETYTLGLWAKGTSNSGRVLALYANGDPAVIGSSDQLKPDWTYYEITFTASICQLNLVASDWGATEIWVDNITLKDTAGEDLLSGYGDFNQTDHTWKEATCTAPKTCMGCGQTQGELLPHTPGQQWTESKAPSFTEAGTQLLCCTVCNAVLEQREIPAYTAEVSQWNVTLGGDLMAAFCLKVDSRLTDGRVCVTVAERSYQYTLSELTQTEDGYRVCVHIAAAEQTEEIRLTVAQGDMTSQPMVYTVANYAKQVLQNESMQEYHQLVRDMLSYGAAAQVYFEYRTQDLANSGITGAGSAELPEAGAYTVTGELEGVTYYGASLLLQNNVGIRFYFLVEGELENYQFAVDGVSCQSAEKDGMYYIEVTDILPQNLDRAMTVTVNDTLSVTYSPMNYMIRMYQKGSDTMKLLVKAMYNYHLAARAFSENPACCDFVRSTSQSPKPSK